MSLARFMQDTGNAAIFGALGEVAIIDGEVHAGVFNRRYAELHLADGMVVGLELSFACSLTAKVRELREGDPVLIKSSVEDAGGEYYRFRRRVPPMGDESGLVVLELGT